MLVAQACVGWVHAHHHGFMMPPQVLKRKLLARRHFVPWGSSTPLPLPAMPKLAPLPEAAPEPATEVRAARNPRTAAALPSIAQGHTPAQ